MSSHNCLSQFLFSSRLLFFFFFFLFLALSTFQAFFFQQQTRSIILRVPSFNLICLKLYDDEKSSIRFFFLFVFFSLSLSLCGFFLVLPVSILSLPRHPSLSDFLDLFVLFSASHPLPSISLSLSLSLCGRVVINPYFIAGEFLSPCRADSSPRSKTLLGPNPILPPSITPSLPPSGPDY